MGVFSLLSKCTSRVPMMALTGEIAATFAVAMSMNSTHTAIIARHMAAHFRKDTPVSVMMPVMFFHMPMSTWDTGTDTASPSAEPSSSASVY